MKTKKLVSFLNLHWPKIIATFFFVVLLSAYTNIFAVFTPGQTLDPTCAPGATGCTVAAATPTSAITTVNTSNLFSTGLMGAGSGATSNTTNSIFLGIDAGKSTDYVQHSNFLGFEAGKTATSANHSNFLGYQAGSNATNAIYSNFIGSQAGYYSSGAYRSNFIGGDAGVYAYSANNSNFIGDSAGVSSNSGSYSNFLGTESGYYATNASNSNFLGYRAGYYATNAPNSNFLGQNAGYYATNAKSSIFIGQNAGYQDTVNNNDPSYESKIPAGVQTMNGWFNGEVNADAYSRSDNTTYTVTCNKSTGFCFWNDSRGGGGNFNTSSHQSDLSYGVYIRFSMPVFNDFQISFTVDGSKKGNYDGSYSILIGKYTNTGGYKNSILLGGGSVNSTIANTKADQFMLAPNIINMRLRGLDYTLPSTQGTSGQVLTNDGSGNLSWGSVSSGSSSPITIVNSSNLFSTGLTGTGSGVTVTSDSIFLGTDAGKNATSASNSNFLGASAGSGASSASNSNFFGQGAGQGAANAIHSNFLGGFVGQNATNASNSNFFGQGAGSNATNASYSNFFGSSAGDFATNASHSNFFGSESGTNATYASNSNFFGNKAGSGAANASNSIFIGQNAGLQDTVDNYSNPTYWSILLGRNTKTGGFSNSILLGGSTDDNFISNTKTNQFMLAPTITDMRLRGVDYNLPSAQGLSGQVLTNDGNGNLSWASVSGGGGSSSPITIVNTSNLFSTGLTGTGSEVTTSTHSIFLGENAGNGATNVDDSNFLGHHAGNGATDVDNSNFLGHLAGYNAIYSSGSNFLGGYSGYNATRASFSNFFGYNTGSGATNSQGSNFFGREAGYGAIDALFSNFFGYEAGYGATNASYSTLIGYQAGKTFTDNNIGSNNIIIGTNVTLPNTVTNSMNIGGILFANGLSGDTSSENPNPNAIGDGKFGINVVSPSYTLEAKATGENNIVARFTNDSGSCDINPVTGGISCSSDINLKKNITLLSDDAKSFELKKDIVVEGKSILDKVLTLTGVKYNWNKESDEEGKHTGFIAQEMEQIFPDLVSTDSKVTTLANGEKVNLKSINYAGITPYLAEAIKEMNLKVETLQSTDIQKENSFGYILNNFLGDVNNGIQSVFFGEVHTKKLCIDDICVDKNQLQQMLNQSQVQPTYYAPVPTAPTTSSTPTTPAVPSTPSTGETGGTTGDSNAAATGGSTGDSSASGSSTSGDESASGSTSGDGSASGSGSSAGGDGASTGDSSATQG